MDALLVNNIFTAIDVLCREVAPLRSGKHDSYKAVQRRPIKVTLPNTGCVSKAHNNLRKVKNMGRFKEYTIFRDKTLFQNK